MENAIDRSDAERRWRRRQLFLRGGQALMALGGLVAAVHWLTHLGLFGPEQPPLPIDLLAGYPMGVLLFITGAILAGQKPR
jgi:hypothetical protein